MSYPDFCRKPFHGGRTLPPLGVRQLALLREAAREVTSACPWVWICSDRRTVESLAARGLVGTTSDAFGITVEGLLELRRHDRPLALRAAKGLRRNRNEGEVLPWQV